MTASPRLTLPAILHEAGTAKGLDLVAVVDAQTSGGLRELEDLLREGVLTERAGGGLATAGGLTLIPAAEVECVQEGAPVHLLGYFPDLASVRSFGGLYAEAVRNPALSTQRTPWSLAEGVAQVRACGGLAVPAHVFTPFRGFYGTTGRRLGEVLPDPLADAVDAVELGLSADTDMADRLSELHGVPFLSSSDAHSLDTIAREYTAFALDAPTWECLRAALRGWQTGPQRPVANFGLDPRLGKYHRTVCRRCGWRPAPAEGWLTCPRCGGSMVVAGVWDRIEALADLPPGVHPAGRPPYTAQVPLAFLPGFGPVWRRRLIATFGSEMAVLHRATTADLAAVVGPQRAELLDAARRGTLELVPGGGGSYGLVTAPEAPTGRGARGGRRGGRQPRRSLGHSPGIPPSNRE
ncbi:MAG: TIGR00375 family protein [Clostridia bacterium]|nr:TIGR00375 family protein [Clostridia bacterium]